MHYYAIRTSQRRCSQCRSCYIVFFFFFQAEDGIRDVAVTGVQTCALPIYVLAAAPISRAGVAIVGRRFERLEQIAASVPSHPVVVAVAGDRLLATTRGDLPATGWASATLRGALQVNGEDSIQGPLRERGGR